MDHQPGARAFEGATPSSSDAPAPPAGARAIGVVIEIAGSSSQVMLDSSALAALSSDRDVAVANSGQVGSQIKMRVGATWLIANIRALEARRRQRRPHRRAGRFPRRRRRGAPDRQALQVPPRRHSLSDARLPGLPGLDRRPEADLRRRRIAPTSRSARVYPTKDIRAALYVDAMLGKHFALLGSTGTGKSTATALILHRICDARARRAIS